MILASIERIASNRVDQKFERGQESIIPVSVVPELRREWLGFNCKVKTF